MGKIMKNEFTHRVVGALSLLKGALFVVLFCLISAIFAVNLSGDVRQIAQNNLSQNTIIATADDLSWTVFSNNSKKLSDASVYLENDIDLSNNLIVSGIVNLDLNGHTLNLNDNQITLNSGAILNIYDTASEGKICCQSGGSVTCITANSTSTINIYGGGIVAESTGGNDCYAIDGGTVNLYGGYISVASNTQSVGAVKGGELNFDGGYTLTNGERYPQTEDKNEEDKEENSGDTDDNKDNNITDNTDNNTGDNTESNQEPTQHEHDYKVSETKPATCTASGKITYLCDGCGDSYSEDIQALNHDITGIAIAIATDKTSYLAFEKFNPAGMVVVVECSRCIGYKTEDYIISYKTGDCLHYNDGCVTVVYFDGTATYTTEQEVDISKVIVDIPDGDNRVFVYNGNLITCDISLNESVYTVINNKQTAAGSYVVKVSLNDSVNYAWTGGSSKDLEYDFVIEKAKIVYPQIESLPYCGFTIAPDVSDTEMYSVVANKGGVDAGVYPVSLKIKQPFAENYEWENGDVTATLDFEIYMASNSISDLKIDNWTYGNAVSTPTAQSDFGEIVFSYSATRNGAYSEKVPTSAGNYFVKAYVAGNDNYEGATEYAQFTILKAEVAIPEACEEEFVYTGYAQEYEIEYNKFYTVTGNKQTSAGRYTVTVELVDTQNVIWTDGEIEAKEYEFVIAKAEIKPQTITNKPYNGNTQIADIEANAYYKVIENLGGVNVGGYKVVFEITDDNYIFVNQDVRIENTFYIYQADNEITKFVVQDFVYGQEITQPTAEAKYGDVITFTYSKSGLSEEYSSTIPSEAGTYFVKAYVAGNDNYKGATDTKRFTISRAEIAKPDVEKQSFVYNGAAQTFVVEESESYYILNNVQTDAGAYEVTISLRNKVNFMWADGTNDDFVYDFIIRKATYDMSGVTFSGATFTEDGEEHSIEISGELPDGVSVSYEGNGQICAGEYTVTAVFSGDKNHTAITPLTAKLIIESAPIPDDQQPDFDDNQADNNEADNNDNLGDSLDDDNSSGNENADNDIEHGEDDNNIIDNITDNDNNIDNDNNTDSEVATPDIDDNQNNNDTITDDNVTDDTITDDNQNSDINDNVPDNNVPDNDESNEEEDNNNTTDENQNNNEEGNDNNVPDESNDNTSDGNNNVPDDNITDNNDTDNDVPDDYQNSNVNIKVSGTGCGSTTLNGGDGMIIGLTIAMIGAALIIRARRKRTN
jgi:hypothetical protein